MPLLKGESNIGHNIEVEEAHGKPHDQAVAIALRTAGVPKKGKDALPAPVPVGDADRYTPVTYDKPDREGYYKGTVKEYVPGANSKKPHIEVEYRGLEGSHGRVIVKVNGIKKFDGTPEAAQTFLRREHGIKHSFDALSSVPLAKDAASHPYVDSPRRPGYCVVCDRRKYGHDDSLEPVPTASDAEPKYAPPPSRPRPLTGPAFLSPERAGEIYRPHTMKELGKAFGKDTVPHKFAPMPGNRRNQPCNRCLECKSHPNHSPVAIADYEYWKAKQEGFKKAKDASEGARVHDIRPAHDEREGFQKLGLSFGKDADTLRKVAKGVYVDIPKGRVMLYSNNAGTEFLIKQAGEILCEHITNRAEAMRALKSLRAEFDPNGVYPSPAKDTMKIEPGEYDFVAGDYPHDFIDAAKKQGLTVTVRRSTGYELGGRKGVTVIVTKPAKDASEGARVQAVAGKHLGKHGVVVTAGASWTVVRFNGDEHGTAVRNEDLRAEGGVADGLEPVEVRDVVNPKEVSRVYSGKPGCMCGCRGNYSTNPAQITRVCNAINSLGGESTPDWHTAETPTRSYTAYLKNGKYAKDIRPAHDEHEGFQKLERSLAHRKGVSDPAALVASIGRKKYGAAGLAKKSVAGRVKDVGKFEIGERVKVRGLEIFGKITHIRYDPNGGPTRYKVEGRYWNEDSLVPAKDASPATDCIYSPSF